MPDGISPGKARPSWAYAYQIVPPQPADDLRAIRALLARERDQARQGERTWEGRLVTEQQVTHILVVSDSPDQGLEFNQRLEAALRELDVGFALTLPLAVADEDEADTPSGD